MKTSLIILVLHFVCVSVYGGFLPSPVNSKSSTLLVPGVFFSELSEVVLYAHTRPINYNGVLNALSDNRISESIRKTCNNKDDPKCNVEDWVLQSLGNLTASIRHRNTTMSTVVGCPDKDTHRSSMTTAEIVNPLQEIDNNFSSISDNINNLQKKIVALPESPKRDNVRTLTFVLAAYEKIGQTLSLNINNDVIAACKENKIPAGMVSPTLLRAHLLKTRQSVSSDGYELAIPPDDINQYYTKEISKCSIRDRNVIVEVGIPLIRKGERWTLHKVTAGTFQNGLSTCWISELPEYIAVNNGKEIVPVDEWMIREDKLVHLPRIRSNTQCLQSLYSGERSTDIRKSCPLTCRSNSRDLSITQLSENDFLVTNPTGNLHGLCGRKQFPVASSNKQHGALHVTIDCDCTLYMGDAEVIPRRYPCLETMTSKQIKTNHVLPAHFSIPHAINKQEVVSLKSVLDTSWNSTDWIVTAGSSFQVEQFAPTFVIVWLALLTAIVSVQLVIIGVIHFTDRIRKGEEVPAASTEIEPLNVCQKPASDEQEKTKR